MFNIKRNLESKKLSSEEKKERRRLKQREALKSNIYSYLILGLAVLYCISHIGGNKLNTIFGYSTALVVSESMVPTLDVNDFVIVKVVDKYNVGDIVLYQHGDDIIIHRIIEKNGTEYTMKGDNNSIADPWTVTEDQILARYEFTIPYIGYVAAYFNDGATAYVLLALIGIYVLYELCVYLFNRCKKT